MSGVKEVDLEREERARAEASRRAAEAERQRQLAAARSGLSAALAQTVETLREAEAASLKILVAGPRLTAAREALASEDIPAINATASIVDGLREFAIRAIHLNHALGAGPVSAAFRDRLGSQRDIQSSITLVEEWSDGIDAERKRVLEGSLRSATSALELIASCEAAGIKLGQDVVAMRAELQAQLRKLGPQSAEQLNRAVGKLPAGMLRIQLESRQNAARRLREIVSAPELSQRLDEWRPGFASTMDGTAARVTSGDWAGTAHVFQELDAFLAHRAQERLGEFARAAREQGLTVTEPILDAATATWVIDVHRGADHLARGTEPGGGWAQFASSPSAMLRIEGPPKRVFGKRPKR